MKQALIIDDDEDNLFVLAKCVERSGINVTAKNQIITLSEILEISPDIILIDQWLNNGYGSTFCECLKNDKRTSSIPVILISAVRSLNEIAAECHADAYLEKPYSFSDIDDLLATHLFPYSSSSSS